MRHFRNAFLVLTITWLLTGHAATATSDVDTTVQTVAAAIRAAQSTATPEPKAGPPAILKATPLTSIDTPKAIPTPTPTPPLTSTAAPAPSSLAPLPKLDLNCTSYTNANRVSDMAFDHDGNVAGSDSITVTSSFDPPAPVIHRVLPADGLPGSRVTVEGTGFLPSIEVLFGGLPSTSVQWIGATMLTASTIETMPSGPILRTPPRTVT